MPEYISREAFCQKCVEVLEGIRSHPAMTLQEMHVVAAIDTVCQIIDDMPAADVVPVVRCRDCIYWEQRTTRSEPEGALGICHAHSDRGLNDPIIVETWDGDYCQDGGVREEKDE